MGAHSLAKEDAHVAGESVTLPRSPSSVIPLLQQLQQDEGFVSEQAIERVAQYTGAPASAVFGVATFYSQFHLRPRGDQVVKICHGTACHVRGAPEVTRAVMEELDIKVGETTEKLDFTLESVACVGCCGLAPVMLVGDKTYGQLNAAEAGGIMATLKEEAAIARGELVADTTDGEEGRSAESAASSAAAGADAE